MKTRCICTSTLLWLLASAGWQAGAAPMNTAFTYQGSLSAGGKSANGLYDFRFGIWDAAANGNQIKGLLTTNAVGVTNGLFTVTLDFGGGVFMGDARWLEVGVCTNADGNFHTLSPRQALTAAPYAIYAPLSGSARTATSASVAFVAEAVQTDAIGGTNIAVGQVVKSLNGLQDAVTLAAGPNLTLATNGSTLTLAAGSASGFWSTAGNADTGADTNFLGTTDAQPLELRVNGQRALRLEPTTNSPNVIGGAPGNSVPSGVVGATIAGGGIAIGPLAETYGNRVEASYGTVGGGIRNDIQPGATYSFIGGGFANQIQAGADSGMIGGGDGNVIEAGSPASALGGGFENRIATNSWSATIGGGANNLIDTNSSYATVGGGSSNTVRGLYGTIPGGFENLVLGDYSLAAGLGAAAQHPGTFVWADSTGEGLASSAPNQFLIRASGGVAIGTNATAGAMLNVAGTVRATGFEFGAGAGSEASFGTVDLLPLEVDVNALPALRLVPTVNDSSHSNMVNIVGGSPANFVDPGVYGSVIGGGGAAAYEYDFRQLSSNSVAADLCFLAGGIGNSIGPGCRFSFLGGGVTNGILGGDNSFLGGGEGNSLVASHSFLGGGLRNCAESSFASFLGGGARNCIQGGFGATGDESFLGAGADNTNRALRGFLGAGEYNIIDAGADFTFLGGGYHNSLQAEALGSFLGGGGWNSVGTNAFWCFLGGGATNSIGVNADDSFLGGGFANSIQAGAELSVIVGGESNTIKTNANGSFVGGGATNCIDYRTSYATIVGGSGNWAGAAGAFVGGGGLLDFEGDWGSLGVGEGNQASGAASVIGGGIGNRAAGVASVVGGGGGYAFLQPLDGGLTLAKVVSGNEASGDLSSVVGGLGNQALGPGAFIGGGGWNGDTSAMSANGNLASGIASCIVGGCGNTNSADYGAISGGIGNTLGVGARYSAIGGGIRNAIADYDYYATIGGGGGNIVQADCATIPGGHSAVAVNYGQFAYASGMFSRAGDAQTSIHLLRQEIRSDLGVKELFLDGSQLRLRVPSKAFWLFDILVLGAEIGTSGRTVGLEVKGVVQNLNGRTYLIGTPTYTTIAESNFGLENPHFTVTTDGQSDALLMFASQDTDPANPNPNTMRWLARVQTVEITGP